MAAAFASRRCRFDQMPRTYLVAAARGKLATSVHRPALGWCSFRLKPRTTGKPFLRFSDSNARSWEWPSVKLGVNLILSPTLKSSSIRTPCNAIPPTSITSQIRYRMRMDAYGRADHKQRWTVDPRDGGDGDIASARPHRDWARLVSRSPPLHNLSRVRRRGLFRRLVPNSPAPGHLPHLQRSGFQPSLNSDEEHAVSRTNAEPVQSNWSDQYLNLLHDSGIGHLLPALPNIARKDVRSQVFAHGSDPERNEEHLVQKQKLPPD
ncbi:hypothetical protein FB451DRAFT_1207017 [Mycena latifolia]|nr:hypothetical protein FB451DRAFT_1207017 [Mycena latifolia]